MEKYKHCTISSNNDVNKYIRYIIYLSKSYIIYEKEKNIHTILFHNLLFCFIFKI